MCDEIDTIMGTLRRGDMLEVEYMRDLGQTQSELLARLNKVRKLGCHVYETATKRSTKTRAAEMIADALPYLRKGLPRPVARANGKKGGRPPDKRAMSKDDAERIWFDLRIKTNRAAIKKMKDWNLSAAYRQLGASGRPSLGRPRQKK